MRFAKRRNAKMTVTYPEKVWERLAIAFSTAEEFVENSRLGCWKPGQSVRFEDIYNVMAIKKTRWGWKLYWRSTTGEKKGGIRK